MKHFCLVQREKVQLFVTEREFAVSSSGSQAVPRSGEHVRPPWSPQAWAGQEMGVPREGAGIRFCLVFMVELLPPSSVQSHLSLVMNPS